MFSTSRTTPPRKSPPSPLLRTVFPRLGLALAALAAGMLALAAPAAAETETFSYTGTTQTWTVPAGVTEATFDLYGAQGGSFSPTGGLGGRAMATIATTPGDSIQLRVGGEGAIGVASPGGFNGGGSGPVPINGYSGGGASDIRIGGTALSDRVLVAGGGGGAGNVFPIPSGGAGGGLVGGDGESQGFPGNVLGGGGTQSAGGTAGGSNATAGVSGVGGDGGWDSFFMDGAGGGGGGGWYGGGGGYGAGGGGGSGYGPQGTVFESGVRSGDGLVTVTYADAPPPPEPPPVDPPPVDPPPVIIALAVTPKSFAVSGSATPLERAKGAQIDLTLSEDARVRFRVRQDPVNRSGGPPPKSPRSFTRELSEGANSVPFTGRLGTAAFKPRRYKLIARARDSAGQRSARVEAAFRIAP